MAKANEGMPEKTSEEKQFLEMMKERKGEEWAAEHEKLILMQAKRVGVL